MFNIKKLLRNFFATLLILSLFANSVFAAPTSPGASSPTNPGVLCLDDADTWVFCDTAMTFGDSSSPIVNGEFTSLTVGTLTSSGVVFSGNAHFNDDVAATFGNTSGSPDFSMGVNSADSDKLTLSRGAVLGTTNVFAVDKTTGAIAFTSSAAVPMTITGASPGGTGHFFVIQNTDITGQTGFRATNSTGAFALLTAYGDTFPATSLRGVTGITSSTAVTVLTNGSVATGGTSGFKLLLGGYNSKNAMSVDYSATYGHVFTIGDQSSTQKKLSIYTGGSAGLPISYIVGGQANTDSNWITRFAHKDSSSSVAIPTYLQVSTNGDSSYTNANTMSFGVGTSAASIILLRGSATNSTIPLYIGTHATEASSVFKIETVANGQGITLTGSAVTSGSPTLLTLTPANHTGLTASTANYTTLFSGATKTWATGDITDQYDHYIRSNTYAFAGASTVTFTAATFAIEGAPTAGANATLTLPFAFLVKSGASGFGGHISSFQQTAPTATLTSTTLNDGAGTGASITVTTGSTDTAGSFTVTAGNGTPTAGVAGQIVFNAAYSMAPKTVQFGYKDADGVTKGIYCATTTTGQFEISFQTALAASEAVEYYYWVVE